jgi:hypothetical protein
VDDPTTVDPDRKSTRAIVPSRSEAVAAKTMLAGAVYVAPLAGAVSATDGGAVATVTETGADVVEAPALSTATAVSVYVPAATLVHVNV